LHSPPSADRTVDGILRLDPLVVVVLIAAAITFSEIALTVEVFHSPYNWFHLH